MPNVNLSVTMGHITRDPELTYTPSGTAICKFGMAINRYWKDDKGQKMESVTFLDYVAWANTAEIVAKYVKKGDSLHVIGSIEQDTWDDKQTGQKRSKLYVRVDGVEFTTKREKEEPRTPAKPPERPLTRKPEPPRDPDLDPDQEDDIPFSSEAHVPR